MAPFDTPIGDLLNPHVISVHVEDDQEKVAQVFSRYGYQAIPVVDGDNRLVGIITVDDVIDVSTRSLQKTCIIWQVSEKKKKWTVPWPTA